MLLNELKILRETDRRPLEGALNALGVSLGGRDRSADKGTGDVAPELQPFVRQYILTSRPAKMTESEVKREMDKVQLKADSAEDKYDQIFRSLSGMRGIIRRLQDSFETQIREFPELDQLARNDSAGRYKDANAWLNYFRLNANLTVDQFPDQIAQMIDKGRDSLDDAVMRQSSAESWATTQANIFKKHLQARGSKPGIDDELARQQVKLTYAVFKHLEDNLTHVLQVIEPLKKAKPKTS